MDLDLGEVEEPAGVDEVGVGELAAVRLGLSAIALVDVGPAEGVAEVLVGQVPERIFPLHDDRRCGRRLGGLGRRGLGDGVGGVGENESPPWVDVLARLQRFAVGLGAADVEVAKLPPAHTGAEEAFGEVPQGVATLHVVDARTLVPSDLFLAVGQADWAWGVLVDRAASVTSGRSVSPGVCSSARVAATGSRRWDGGADVEVVGRLSVATARDAAASRLAARCCAGCRPARRRAGRLRMSATSSTASPRVKLAQASQSSTARVLMMVVSSICPLVMAWAS